MLGHIILNFPPENSEVISDSISLDILVPMPLAVSAGQKIGFFIEEGSDIPNEHRLKAKWKLPADMDPMEVCTEGIRLDPGKPPSYVALKNGFLIAHRQKLKVTNLYEVFSDLNRRTGNISTIAPVLVHGTVSQSVVISSDGDVEVRGLVEDAEIRSRGDIVAKGGIAGNNIGRLIAGKNIYSQFVQHAVLEAPGDILVDGPVMNSNILCGKRLIIRKNGTLVGGKVRVRELVEATRVGSEGALQTEIELGSNPFQSIIAEKLKQEVEELEKQKEMILTAVQHCSNELPIMLNFNPSDMVTSLFNAAEAVRREGNNLDAEQMEKLNEFGAGTMRLMEIMEEIEEKSEKLAEIIRNETQFKSARLKVKQVAHPGTVININEGSMRLDREYNRVSFYYDDKKSAIGMSFQ